MPRTAGVSFERSTLLAHLVEAEADQRRALVAGRRIGLPICSTVTVLSAISWPWISAPCASFAALRSTPAARLERRDLDAAAGRDERGLSCVLQRVEGGAHHVVGVGRAERLGDDVLMPSVSNTARIGPPAMMPVPAGAARRMTLPAP
jgi:hypothetical protein